MPIANRILDHLNDKGFLDEGEYEQGLNAINSERVPLPYFSIGYHIADDEERFLIFQIFIAGNGFFMLYIIRQVGNLNTVALHPEFNGDIYERNKDWLEDLGKVGITKFFMYIIFRLFSQEMKNWRISTVGDIHALGERGDEGSSEVEQLPVFLQQVFASRVLVPDLGITNNMTIEEYDNTLKGTFESGDNVLSHYLDTLRTNLNNEHAIYIPIYLYLFVSPIRMNNLENFRNTLRHFEYINIRNN